MMMSFCKVLLIIASFKAFVLVTCHGAAGPPTFYDTCRSSLGLESGNGSIEISPSSLFVPNHEGNNARLNNSKGWVSSSNSSETHITFIFKKKYIITGIATQGVPNFGWVTYFTVAFRGYGTDLVDLMDAKDIIQFHGNTDPINVTYIRIQPIVVTDKIRINIKEWHNKIALRAEVYGCTVSEKTAYHTALGMENNAIPDSWITSNQSNNSSTPAEYARLNTIGTDINTCWSPTGNDWLQVNFDDGARYITAVLTQGCNNRWVTSFKISYKALSIMQYYNETLIGNLEGKVKKNILSPIIATTTIRIHPISWQIRADLRLELLGCSQNNTDCEGVRWNGTEAWSGCNATCDGTRHRFAKCNVVPKSYCTDPPIEYQPCDREDFCKNFTSWSVWSPCTNSCGPGEQMRSRNYTGNYQNNKCLGMLAVLRGCNGTCEIRYGEWSSWSECNMTCGIGFRERNRTCDKHKPEQVCSYAHEVETCNKTYSNHSDGGTWSAWGPCTKTCSIYSQNRTRTINSKKEIYSRNCTPCLPCMCIWSKWTECVCGRPANQTRSRNCTGTEPHNLVCSGTTVDSKPCNLSYCIVDGKFTEWSNWTSCSLPCGNGTQHRNRSCTNPPPKYGGRNCTGPSNETQSCNTIPCPVDGNFTEWSNWTTCSLTCGNGKQYRNRSCTKPSPAHGGKNCTGPLNETQRCNTWPCPVDGKFTQWSNWTACSQTCGDASQYRNRSCTEPAPTHGGKNCIGPFNETRSCNTTACQVNGNFSKWSDWSPCTHTCGNGTQQRMRTCTNPAPEHGGANCSGNSSEIQRCKLQECPVIQVDGGFTQWNVWTNCTLPCGSGTKQRMRTCTNPTPANGGDNCTGEFFQKIICNTHFCPINGKWTKWTDWSYCNRPCGIGYQNRTRSCTDPLPKYGGTNCVGNSSESIECDTNQACPEAVITVNTTFTNESFSDNLKKLNSRESISLKDKILQNVEGLYTDKNVVNKINIISFSKGSVVATFDIWFAKMDSIQLIILQESIEVKRMITNMPLQISTINATRVPRGRPSVETIKNTTSTSVNVQWSSIPETAFNNPTLKGYSIFFKENDVQYSPNQMVAIESQSINNYTVSGLKKYTDYTLRVLAYSVKGNGIASNPVNFKTDEDVPSRSPGSFTVTPISATALQLSWKHIPQQYVHGILRGYNITALNMRTGTIKVHNAEYFQWYATLNGLEKYARYSVEICGYTSKGCGLKSQLEMSTLEDVPTMPPANAIAYGLSSTSKITIKWAPVPVEGINGILKKYVITYRLHTLARTRMFESKTITIIADPSKRKWKIPGLRPFARYEFQIAALNSKGLGPFATFYGDTCRCPEKIYTNYWFLTPYFNSTPTGDKKGIFAHIISNMFKWACADCKNGHRFTNVDFERDGNGSRAMKNSILDVAGNVDNGAQASFPINGNKDTNRVYGDQVFIPIVQSPGIAYLVVPINKGSTAMNVFKSIMGSIPFILFSIGLAYLAGVIIWFLDAGQIGSTFPVRFSLGVFEGLWWSFISMTTVGYGDRSPISFLSRWFAMLWTLYGIALISLLTSTMSTSLTSVTLQAQTSIYGATIAAIQNSSEHRIGILKNGKVNEDQEHFSVSDIYLSLVNGDVYGALIDTFVVAAQAQLFTDAGIRVAKILNRPFGYGVALSSEISVIEQECLQYLHANAKQITQLIDISTQKLTVPSIDDSKSKDTRLFDSTSVLFRNTLIFVCSMLGFGTLCGLIYHFTCYRKGRHKVAPHTAEMIARKEATVLKMRALVDKFYDQATTTINEMRTRHKKEKYKICQRMKERKIQEKKIEKAQAKAARKKARQEDPNGEYNLSDLIELAANMVRS